LCRSLDCNISCPFKKTDLKIINLRVKEKKDIS
jgi:hypothetical protein